MSQFCAFLLIANVLALDTCPNEADDESYRDLPWQLETNNYAQKWRRFI